jgi:hypothetical protein
LSREMRALGYRKLSARPRHRGQCSEDIAAFKKGSVPRYIGSTKGGLNSKLHAVCDGSGRPLILCLAEGQMSDHIGAKIKYPVLPGHAKCMIGDKGYDSDEYRAALKR